VGFVEGVTYDGLGGREAVMSDSGSRSFTYNTAHQLATDVFTGTSGAYAFSRGYDAYDKLGNVLSVTGTSTPGDAIIAEDYTYDPRNRLASWTKEGATYSYGDPFPENRSKQNVCLLASSTEVEGIWP
jgi:hypothetical protein